MKIEKSYTTIDVHVAGEAFRIIQNVPLAYYESLQNLADQLFLVYEDEKNLLLNEPRGFAGVHGCLVVPPFSRDADVAIIFFDHKRTIPVYYGGIVAVMTALLECGNLQVRSSNVYKVETAIGIISVIAIMDKGEVVSIMLESEPGQSVNPNASLNSQKFNRRFSLVQTDQLYAVFPRTSDLIEINFKNLSELKRWSKAVFDSLDPIICIDGVILLDDSALQKGRIKTITFREDGFIVRSPGFGPTMASYISLHTKGEITLGQPLLNDSIFGSQLKVETARQTDSNYHLTIKSRGFITGMHTFLLDPTDPLRHGFLLK